MIPTTLLGRIGAAAALAVVLIAAGVSFIAWQRHDAAQDARNQVAVDAAAIEQDVRHGADQAARAAERAGAVVRMRDGNF